MKSKHFPPSAALLTELGLAYQPKPLTAESVVEAADAPGDSRTLALWYWPGNPFYVLEAWRNGSPLARQWLHWHSEMALRLHIQGIKARYAKP